MWWLLSTLITVGSVALAYDMYVWAGLLWMYALVTAIWFKEPTP